jgi:hypothetical protein
MRREPKSAGEDFIRRQADLGNKSTAHQSPDELRIAILLDISTS